MLFRSIAAFPEDAQNKEDLIRKADMAMYQVKQSSRNAIAVAGLGMVPAVEVPAS